MESPIPLKAALKALAGVATECAFGQSGERLAVTQPGAVRRLPVLLALLAGQLGCWPCVQAAVVYVNGSLTNLASPDGRAWDTAYATVQQGLNAATNADEVWVARGIYFERITLKAGVALYGGFAGAETNGAQRNWVSNPTTLDGSSLGTVVIAPKGATNTTRLDGFVIQNGSGGSTGGGLRCVDASPVIANNTITRNSVAGSGQGHGLYCLRSYAVITNNWIVGNFRKVSYVDGSMGGGLYSEAGSPTILYNRFIGNQATTGGGISLSGGKATIGYNLFFGNYADAMGGGIECDSCAAVVYNNRLIANAAWCWTTPSLCQGGGGMSCALTPAASLYNNLFLANVATNTTGGAEGGAVLLYVSGSPTLINNTLLRNRADHGGGLYSSSTGRPILVNNLIAFGNSGVATPNLLDFRNNCVFGNGTNDFVGWPDPTGTEGNIAADPHLDEHPEYGTAHLRPDSPCRDAGDSSVVQPDWVDINGSPRLQGAAVDLGAEESDGLKVITVPRVVRVAPQGDDAQDGSSWPAAKRTVQAAIDFASAVGGEVWVKAGTYAESVQLRPYTYLYGGFGGDELVRDQRDWVANVCVLDANHQGPVVMVNFLGSVAAVDGFTVRNGTAPRGGGIQCLSASPSIRHNQILSNTAAIGGGIFCNDELRGVFPSPVIANNWITGNMAVTNGTPTSAQGGGLYVQSSWGQIINNVILSNRVVGPYYPGNGGAAMLFSYGNPLVANNTILGNSLTDESAGALGATVTCLSGGPWLFVNNLVVSNSSGVRVTADETPAVFRHNCVFGNAHYDYVITTNFTATNGNISLDPLLAADGLHLSAGSPCLDAGDDSVVQSDWLDIEGRPRVLGDHVDIGASETVLPGTWVPWSPPTGQIQVTVQTVGGITYGQYTVGLPDTCFRLGSVGPLSQTGTQFSMSFLIEHQEGVACAPLAREVQGAFAVGVLAPGDYLLGIVSNGRVISLVSFGVPPGPDRTLQSVALTADGHLRFDLVGVAGISYFLQVSEDLSRWQTVTTNSGPKFEWTDPEPAQRFTRFYRAMIQP